MITAPSMNPGRLDRRIALRYPVEEQSSTGAITRTWVDLGTVWASWLPRSGREFTAALARHAEATGIFRIRHSAHLTTHWRLVHGDDLFEIIDAQEVGRREYLDLIVRAQDQSPTSALAALRLESTDPTACLLLEDGTLLTLETAA